MRSPSSRTPSPVARERPGAHWKVVADWAKSRPSVLRLADRLGRSRGRLAILDRLNEPPRSPLKPNLANWTSTELAAVWIGHATLLLRIGGQTVLTDPVFANRVGIGMGLMTVGPRRRYAPSIALHDLPPINLILLSHAHFDHLDRPTLSKLPKRIPVVTAAHTADLLQDLGYRKVRELRWKESVDVGPLRLSAEPVEHWGARTFHDPHRGYNAYTIESLTGRNRRILFGGDSAYHDHWKDVPPVDLAIVGIGAYNPHVRGHATPEQAWQMANHAKADVFVPMHFSTFKLSYEPWGEPIERLMNIAGAKERVPIREIGGTWAL